MKVDYTKPVDGVACAAEIVRLLRQHKNHVEIRAAACRDHEERGELLFDVAACEYHIGGLQREIDKIKTVRKVVDEFVQSGVVFLRMEDIDPRN